MLLQLSNIINSYLVYSISTEYRGKFRCSYDDSISCKLRNIGKGIWDSFSYNYRSNMHFHRNIYNITTGRIPNITLPKNY